MKQTPGMGDHSRKKQARLRSDLFRLLREKHSFLLTTHVNPDGDGLGCEYALFHFLRSLNKSVRIVNADPLPRNYSFLGTGALYETYDPEIHSPAVFDADVILMVDMNDPRRLSVMEHPVLGSSAVKVVIDHHLDPKEFTDLSYIEESACSCGEMLFDLLSVDDGWSPSTEQARGIYVAIMTDTGSFRFPRTTPRVHRIVAVLLEQGIAPHEIYRTIYDEYPIGRTILIGRILATIRLLCGGRVTLSYVTREMFRETGTSEEDIEHVVNYGLTIEGIVATALCVDLGGLIKVSLRSVGDIDVRTVAKSFGGGGHANAAGARISGTTLAEALERVGDALCRQIGETP